MKIYILTDADDSQVLLLSTSYTRVLKRLLHYVRRDTGDILYAYRNEKFEELDVKEYHDLNEDELYNTLEQKYGKSIFHDILKAVLYEYYNIDSEELVEE